MRPPGSAAARTAVALADPVATRFVPSSGSTAMSTAVAASGLPTCSPMNSIGALSRSPSPMTIVPLISASSIALRMAVTAAWSAPIRSPRPMRRAAAIAPASVARTASAMISLSMAQRLSGDGVYTVYTRMPTQTSSMSEVPAAGEDHGQVVAIGDLDRHLVADAAAGLDDRGHAGLRGDLDSVGEREIGVRRHDRQRRALACLAQRDL